MRLTRFVVSVVLMLILVLTSASFTSVMATTNNKVQVKKPYVINSQNGYDADTRLYYEETSTQITAVYYPATPSEVVNEQLLAYIKDSIASLTNSINEETTSFIKPTVYGDYVLYSYSPEIVTVKFELSIYGGNAPVVNDVHTLTFNLSTGMALGSEALFTNGFSEHLVKTSHSIESLRGYAFTPQNLICFFASEDDSTFTEVEIELMKLLNVVKFRVLNGADPNELPKAPSKAPKVALTFDDGPHPEYTAKILNELIKRNAVATFYVLGDRVEQQPRLTRRIIREGSELGNHSWDHPNLASLSPSAVVSQIKRTNDIIHAVTGTFPKTMRPPFGFHSPVVTSAVEMPLVLWSMDPADWHNRNAEAIVEYIASSVKNGDIILLHDIYLSTAEAVGPLVDALQSRGFELVTVSELLSLADYPINALSGKVINKK